MISDIVVKNYNLKYFFFLFLKKRTLKKYLGTILLRNIIKNKKCVGLEAAVEPTLLKRKKLPTNRNIAYIKINNNIFVTLP